MCEHIKLVRDRKTFFFTSIMRAQQLQSIVFQPYILLLVIFILSLSIIVDASSCKANRRKQFFGACWALLFSWHVFTFFRTCSSSHSRNQFGSFFYFFFISLLFLLIFYFYLWVSQLVGDRISSSRAPHNRIHFLFSDYQSNMGNFSSFFVISVSMNWLKVIDDIIQTMNRIWMSANQQWDISLWQCDTWNSNSLAHVSTVITHTTAQIAIFTMHWRLLHYLNPLHPSFHHVSTIISEYCSHCDCMQSNTKKRRRGDELNRVERKLKMIDILQLQFIRKRRQ